MSAMREQMNASRNVSTPMDRMHVPVELDTDSFQMGTTALVIKPEYIITHVYHNCDSSNARH